MTMRRMVMRTEIAAETSDRTVTVKCSTEALGRDDMILRSAGIGLDAYRENPVFLWQHNPDWPVARAEKIDVVGGDLVAHVRFPDEGVSQRADEVYGLIRAGIINAASTGFDVIDMEPIDPAKPRGGTCVTRCELHEVSFVSIPAVRDALITERSAPDQEWLDNLHAGIIETVERSLPSIPSATTQEAIPDVTTRRSVFHRHMAKLFERELTLVN